MSRRGRGRPLKTEHEQMGQLLWFERLMEEETETLQRQGYRGYKPTKALARVAARLKISESTAWRIAAEMKRQDEQLKASIAVLWREIYGSSLTKNDGTELLTVNSCGAD
jgi:hypothetical protein